MEITIKLNNEDINELTFDILKSLVEKGKVPTPVKVVEAEVPTPTSIKAEAEVPTPTKVESEVPATPKKEKVVKPKATKEVEQPKEAVVEAPTEPEIVATEPTNVTKEELIAYAKQFLQPRYLLPFKAMLKELGVEKISLLSEDKYELAYTMLQDIEANVIPF